MMVNRMVFLVGMLTLGVVSFGVLLFALGCADIALAGGNSDAAKFAGWVVDTIR